MSSNFLFRLWQRGATAFGVVSLALLLVASCTDDGDDMLESYRFDLCELTTDAQGLLTQLRFDDGRTLIPTQQYTLSAPDSLYRAIAIYMPVGEGKAEIRQLGAVISPLPVVFEQRPVVKDPVRVLTSWKTSRYFNLRVGVRRSGTQLHTFGFAEEKIETLPNGKRRLRIALYHDSQNDAPNFEDETYLSCPLYPYEQRLTRGVDSVVMVVNTPQGEQRFPALF